jgi:SNF family Na+-dependent transporter
MMNSLDKRRIWKYIGVFGIFSNIGIASYYCYLESWTLSYVFHSAIGSFNGLSQEGVVQVFNDYVSLDKATLIPYESIIFFVLCLALNTWILSKGLSGGVEKVAKIGMPLLIGFGIILAIRAVTLKAGQNGAIYDGTEGLNFLWTPNFDSITNPKVWLAAAGQIFFTLSLGMGSIQAYASYLKHKDDIALNAMSAGWMNEFVEVVLGGAIIIPISIGYLGIDRVVELANLGGLGMGFKTIPYLFNQWGTIIAAIAGVMWFGLLFFAGITSSLAMGVPCIGFMQDEFKWSKNKSAIAFGLTILLLGLPTVIFFNYGVFDEYDYWTGTVSLFTFALFEAVLFAWIFGMKKGWREINFGADIKVPIIYKYIIKYITPVLLIFVFLGALITPKDNDWQTAFKNLGESKVWVLDNSSLIKQIANSSLKQEIASATDIETKNHLEKKLWLINGTRILLLSVFIGIALLVHIANKKRKKERIRL